jgi:hypothetical protein
VQHRVAGARGEAVVEPGVLCGERGDRGEALAAVAAGRAVGQVGLDPQDGDLVGVDAVGGHPANRRGLQDQPHLDQLVELVTGEQGRGGVAGERALADQPVGLQAGQRLADRGG